jgi:hypothetical protein
VKGLGRSHVLASGVLGHEMDIAVRTSSVGTDWPLVTALKALRQPGCQPRWRSVTVEHP